MGCNLQIIVLRPFGTTSVLLNAKLQKYCQNFQIILEIYFKILCMYLTTSKQSLYTSGCFSLSVYYQLNRKCCPLLKATNLPNKQSTSILLVHYLVLLMCLVLSAPYKLVSSRWPVTVKYRCSQRKWLYHWGGKKLEWSNNDKNMYFLLILFALIMKYFCPFKRSIYQPFFYWIWSIFDVKIRNN